MTAPSELRRLFSLWRGLPVFDGAVRYRARLDRAELTLTTRHGAEATGHAECLPGRYRILVSVGYDMADAHATLLHEMAHVAAGWDRQFHTREWREVFASAAAQITGIQVAIPRGSHFAFHDLIRDCFATARRARRTA